ncbi:MAG TPA: prepilin-type N-terminal cleavage/methylation domain-containing protein [Terriglobales bacterium]
MSDRSTKREGGFSLMEMMIAIALGTAVLGAAVQIYIQGVSATWTVTQRAEMQQDFRAASNILTKDLSLAGAGLGNGVSIALPSGTTPVYGCDQTATCYINGTSVKYPVNSGTPYLYGLLPGYNVGPTLVTAQGPTDAVTVVYTDNSFYLNCYTATATAVGVITFGPATTPLTAGLPPAFPSAGCLPTGVTTAQAVNDPVVGLVPGDLVMMTLNGATVIGEVTAGTIATGTNAVGTTYAVPFANGDVLHMNQTTGTNYFNTEPKNATGTSPMRVQVITYYLDSSVSPARLMRQISGHTPMPVAENVVYMKFSYDLFNSTSDLPAVNCSNPGAATDGCNTAGASAGLTPVNITKINILNMAIDSSQVGFSNSQASYQRLDLQTSVAARNLTYTNNYPN